jgi:hypothetical protein
LVFLNHVEDRCAYPGFDDLAVDLDAGERVKKASPKEPSKQLRGCPQSDFDVLP